MNKYLSCLSFIICFMMAFEAFSLTHDKSQAHITVELLTEINTIVPGEPFRVGVKFKPDLNWHVYWVNPGDTGLAPKIDWTLPEGSEISPVNWPYPKISPWDT